jgi:hypothetical protein
VWTKVDLNFLPEQYRVQLTSLWSYREPQAVDGDIYKIDQRWVKNNRDPDNVVLGTVLREHDKSISDDTPSLLSMTFADNALFGHATLAELQE